MGIIMIVPIEFLFQRELQDYWTSIFVVHFIFGGNKVYRYMWIVSTIKSYKFISFLLSTLEGMLEEVTGKSFIQTRESSFHWQVKELAGLQNGKVIAAFAYEQPVLNNEKKVSFLISPLIKSVGITFAHFLETSTEKGHTQKKNFKRSLKSLIQNVNERGGREENVTSNHELILRCCDFKILLYRPFSLPPASKEKYNQILSFVQRKKKQTNISLFVRANNSRKGEKKRSQLRGFTLASNCCCCC